MAYMDVGNIYSQLYRKPKYTQIGATRVYEPMRINLDQMYGQRYEQTQMPTAPTSPTYTPPISTGAGMPTAGQGIDEQYLASQGWVKITPVGDPANVKLWMPGTANEGDLYETAGARYYYYNGQWYKMHIDPETGQYALPEDIATVAAPPMSEEDKTYLDYQQKLLGDLQKLKAGYDQELATLKMNQQRSNRPQQFQKQIDELEWTISVINSQIEEAQGRIDKTNDKYKATAREFGTEPTIASWQDQYDQLMQQLGTGELSYFDENGNLDLTALRGMNNMWGDWFADILEESYQTGAIAGDILNYNPETGEWELAEELQTMEEYIGLQNEEVIKEWQQFNRQLALNAIASGHSLNSGFYSEVLASNLADYTMNVTNQIAGVMMGEIQAQYQYITNSIKEALIDIGVNVDTEAFMGDVATQWEAIQEQYREQVELLAQQVAETEASRRGQVLAAAILVIAQIAMAIIASL